MEHLPHISPTSVWTAKSPPGRMTPSPRHRAVVALALGLTLALAACATASGPAASTGGQPAASTGGLPASSGDQTGSGEEGVEGSLVTSGLYDATWSWQEGNAWLVADGSITLNSDEDTFGSIIVTRDGSIRFDSAAPELAAGFPYEGTGAQVTLGTGPIEVVCSFTLDSDLTGTDNSVLHIAGTMTFHSNDEFTPC